MLDSNHFYKSLNWNTEFQYIQRECIFILTLTYCSIWLLRKQSSLYNLYPLYPNIFTLSRIRLLKSWFSDANIKLPVKNSPSFLRKRYFSIQVEWTRENLNMNVQLTNRFNIEFLTTFQDKWGNLAFWKFHKTLKKLDLLIRVLIFNP